MDPEGKACDCKHSVDTGACHTAAAPGRYSARPSTVRDMCPAGPRLLVSNPLFFIHPLNKHWLSTCCAPDSQARERQP